MGGKSPGNDSTTAHSRFQQVDAKAAAATLGRTTRTLREWAKRGRLNGDTARTIRSAIGSRRLGTRVEIEEAKGEVDAETHPELYRQVAGARN